MVRKLTIILLASTATFCAACGSSDKPAPTTRASVSAQGSGHSVDTSYNPKIVPAQFTSRITNTYWPMKPGAKWVYTGTKDGAPQRVDVAVSRQAKTVLGVRCIVVSDVVTSNHTLVEKTTDWYAQDRQGNVWYFGEHTKEYKNGVVTSTHGTWEAGVDNAKPGIVVQGTPRVGGYYRQEYRPGQAEDKAKVVSISASGRVPAGTFHRVLLTRDIDPLNPDKVEHKWYAAGVGPIHVLRIGSAHHEQTKLVSYRR